MHKIHNTLGQNSKARAHAATKTPQHPIIFLTVIRTTSAFLSHASGSTIALRALNDRSIVIEKCVPCRRLRQSLANNVLSRLDVLWHNVPSCSVSWHLHAPDHGSLKHKISKGLGMIGTKLDVHPSIQPSGHPLIHPSIHPLAIH